MGQGKDDKQAINGYCRTNHKGFEAHIHFLLLEHDLNFPAMGVMRKNFPIRKAEIRANEHAERLLAAKCILGIGEQDNSLFDSVARQKILCKRRQAVVKETGANQRISRAGHNPA